MIFYGGRKNPFLFGASTHEHQLIAWWFVITVETLVLVQVLAEVPFELAGWCDPLIVSCHISTDLVGLYLKLRTMAEAGNLTVHNRNTKVLFYSIIRLVRIVDDPSDSLIGPKEHFP